MPRVPTVADLRARRLERRRAPRCASASSAATSTTCASSSSRWPEEFDLVEIAAAAVKLVLEADGRAGEETDLPDPVRPAGRAERAARADAGRPMVRLFVGAGRAAGIRPGDLVGAITGETGHDSRAVGSIEIADRFSIVEVPVELEKEITTALRGTKLRGKKVVVSRDRGKKRA